MHNFNRFGGIGYLVIKLTSTNQEPVISFFLFNTLHIQDRCWKYVEIFSLKNNSVFSAKPSSILSQLFNFSQLFFEHAASSNLWFVNFTVTAFGLFLFLWLIGSLWQASISELSTLISTAPRITIHFVSRASSDMLGIPLISKLLRQVYCSRAWLYFSMSMIWSCCSS